VFIGGDPATVSAELDEHLQSCPICQEFRELILTLETRLRKALNLELRTPTLGIRRASGSVREPKSIPNSPTGFVQRALKWCPSPRLIAAMWAGLVVWIDRTPETLAADIIDHIGHEAEWRTQKRTVSPSTVNPILRERGLVLKPSPLSTSIIYARCCNFHGQRVAHLVVCTKSGPVTVILLAHNRVFITESFELEGYQGMIVPIQGGTVAAIGYSERALESGLHKVLCGLELLPTNPQAVPQRAAGAY
jgi:hypothetical protein